MKIYFDTSFLVALYVPNDHTAAALRHYFAKIQMNSATLMFFRAAKAAGTKRQIKEELQELMRCGFRRLAL